MLFSFTSWFFYHMKNKWQQDHHLLKIQTNYICHVINEHLSRFVNEWGKIMSWMIHILWWQLIYFNVMCSFTHLLVFGDGIQKLCVQLGVVLGQWLVAVVIDELHYRQEGQRLWETVPRVSVINLYKLVVPPLPADGDRSQENMVVNKTMYCNTCCPSSSKGLVCFYYISFSYRYTKSEVSIEEQLLLHLSVRVYSPSSLLEASRTRKVPSGVSRIFSFTSSLQIQQHI